MKFLSRFNSRLIFLLVMLIAGAAIQIIGEHRPSVLRPGLRMYAYVTNSADGTVSVATR